MFAYTESSFLKWARMMETAAAAPRFLVAQYQFEDMHLRIGDRCQLELREHPAQRHYGALVGYASGQSILVKTPYVGGLPLPYLDGQELIVRAFTGMGLFAFDASVQRVCIAPFHYLHLTFPSAVRGTQIRSTERVKVTMPTQVSLDGGAPHAGVITDIGIGGAMLECALQLKTGDSVQVYVSFALEQMQVKAGFEAQAAVHRQLPSTHSDRAGMLQCYGLEFDSLTLGQRIMLQNFIYHQLLEDHQFLI